MRALVLSLLLTVPSWGAVAAAQDPAIEARVPCVVECPAGAMVEGEPPCQDGYVDQYNWGCWAQGEDRRWTPLPAQDGDSAVLCGKTCTYLANGYSYRDSDWYAATAAGGPVTLTLLSECAVSMVLWLDTTCGDWWSYPQGSAGECESLQLQWTFPPGHDFWILVAPQTFWGYPEEVDYVLEVDGIQPLPVPTQARTWGGIKARYR